MKTFEESLSKRERGELTEICVHRGSNTIIKGITDKNIMIEKVSEEYEKEKDSLDAKEVT